MLENYTKKRHWSERVFWTFAVITSIVLCSYLVYDTWLKWQNTPVIVIKGSIYILDLMFRLYFECSFFSSIF